MAKSTTLARCRTRLAILWFGGSALLMLLMIVNSINRSFGKQTTDAWSWFIPTVFPSLSLMIGVLIHNGLASRRGKISVDGLLFNVAFLMSLIYLLLVFGSISLYGFSRKPPVEFMTESNLWLGPLQGLVTATIGFFFVKGSAAAPA